jgi:hypothetical protein
MYRSISEERTNIWNGGVVHSFAVFMELEFEQSSLSYQHIRAMSGLLPESIE